MDLRTRDVLGRLEVILDCVNHADHSGGSETGRARSDTFVISTRIPNNPRVVGKACARRVRHRDQ